MESPANKIELKIVNAYDIYVKEMPPTKWYLEGIIHEGACLFTGDPKVGKSYFGIQLAIAVAGSAQTAFGEIPVGQHGRVLYLALDDTSEKRIHKRLHDLTTDTEAVKNIDIVSQRDLPTLKDGLTGLLDDCIAEKKYVLVILDTLGAVSAGTGNKNVYDAEYKEAVGLAALAQKHGICLLIIHHTNKREDGDMNAKASGSHGRAGGVDSLLQLSAKGELDSKPRDGESSRLYMERTENGGWRVKQMQLGLFPPEAELNLERQEIKTVLLGGPKFTGEIAEALGLKPDTARKRCQRYADVVRHLPDGRYKWIQRVPAVCPVQLSEEAIPAEVAA